MELRQLVYTLLMLVIRGRPCWLQDICDQCDCTLSSEDDRKAIFSVRSRCSTGSLQWLSAYGALRLQFQPQVSVFKPGPAPLTAGKAGGEGARGSTAFRLCFVVESHDTVTQVSQETLAPPAPASGKKRLGNYRLGLRHREAQEEVTLGRAEVTLKPLVVVSGGRSPEVCVTSQEQGGKVLLYVEVEGSNQRRGIPSVSLQYDLEVLDPLVLQDPFHECRPCTQEELLDSYCTSDFVAVGTIQSTSPALSSLSGASNQSGYSSIQIEVAVAQLIHQNAPVFQRLDRADRYLYGTLLAPGHCGIQVGKSSQNLLLTGRMRLGQPKLRCAPYYEDWLRIASQAECVYD